ncbi:MAG: hypothetical protein IJZ57_07425 [Clostridia bacterium]|nr:hypothetical protein [Clostridia bacterium]
MVDFYCREARLIIN